MNLIYSCWICSIIIKIRKVQLISIFQHSSSHFNTTSKSTNSRSIMYEWQTIKIILHISIKHKLSLRMSHNYHYLFKYVVAGETNVGKSTFIQQFTEETSRNTYCPTQKINFASKCLKVNELSIKCQVWDLVLNSQSLEKSKRSKNLGDSLFKKATAIILIFDVTNRDSFQCIQRWIHDIRQTWGEKITLGVIGNKIDLEEKRVVSQSELTQFAKQNRVYCAESSSHNYSMVQNIYLQISKLVLEKISSHSMSLEEKLKQSGIKKGKKEVESPKDSLIECTSYQMVQSRWSREEQIQDSQKLTNAVEQVMLTLKKTQLTEQILQDLKHNIKQKGINYIDELTEHYSDLKIAKQSNIIQGLFNILRLIQSEFTSSQKCFERISLQKQQLVKFHDQEIELRELRQNHNELQKKIESLNSQKIKLEQFKEQREKREKDLLAMIDSLKKQKKQIRQKWQKQRRQLNELQNKNMELTKQIQTFRQFEQQMKIKQMMEEKQNTEIIQKLDDLEESGENVELIAKLKKKFSSSNSIVSQINRFSNNY